MISVRVRYSYSLRLLVWHLNLYLPKFGVLMNKNSVTEVSEMAFYLLKHQDYSTEQDGVSGFCHLPVLAIAVFK